MSEEALPSTSGGSSVPENEEGLISAVMDNCGVSNPVIDAARDFPFDWTSYSIVRATMSEGSKKDFGKPSLLPLVVTALLVWIKILLSASISLDSMFPRCVSNGQCNSGLYCMPVAGLVVGGLSRAQLPTEDNANSICQDCTLAFALGNATAGTPLESYLKNGVDYCSNAKSKIDRCDFFMKNRAMYSVLSSIVLFCTVVMFGRMIHLDLVKCRKQKTLYQCRIDKMAVSPQSISSGHVYLYTAKLLHWFVVVSRSYVLPCWMGSAATLLLMSWAPTTRNLILVPIQIGLIANFETAVEFIFLKEKHRALVKEAAHDLVDKSWSFSYVTLRRVEAGLFSLFATGIALSIPIMVLQVDQSSYSKVNFFLASVGYSSRYYTSLRVPCSEVLTSVFFIEMLQSVPLAFFMGIATLIYHRRDNSSAHTQKKAFQDFGVVCFQATCTFGFVLYAWVILFELITSLQFRSL